MIKIITQNSLDSQTWIFHVNGNESKPRQNELIQSTKGKGT